MLIAGKHFNRYYGTKKCGSAHVSRYTPEYMLCNDVYVSGRRSFSKIAVGIGVHDLYITTIGPYAFNRCWSHDLDKELISELQTVLLDPQFEANFYTLSETAICKVFELINKITAEIVLLYEKTSNEITIHTTRYKNIITKRCVTVDSDSNNIVIRAYNKKLLELSVHNNVRINLIIFNNVILSIRIKNVIDVRKLANFDEVLDLTGMPLLKWIEAAADNISVYLRPRNSY